MAFSGGAPVPVKPIRSTKPKQMNSFAFKGGVGSALTKTRRPAYGGVWGGVGTALNPPRFGMGGGLGGAVTRAVRAPTVAPPVAAPQAPQAPQPAKPPSYLDAQYFTNLAQARYQADQDIAGLNQQSTYEKAALAEALRRMAENQSAQEQSTTSAGNAAGLLYSGALGRQLGDVRTDFFRQRSDAQNTFDQSEAGRKQQMQTILGNLKYLDEQEQLAAIARQAELDANSPLVAPDGVPVVGPPPTVAQQNQAAARRAAKAAVTAKNKAASAQAAADAARAQQRARQAQKRKGR